MKSVLLFYICCFILDVYSNRSLQDKDKQKDKENNDKILPFTSIKILTSDEIYITLDTKRKNWHKLLSLDSIGYDAIIKFAKDHYGMGSCDYEIECYKYNIIVNFDTIYKRMNDRKLPEKLGIEYAFDNQIQNGVDVESTKEKYDINQKSISDNIGMSKDKKPGFKIFSTYKDNLIFKGLSNTFNKMFNSKDDENGKYSCII